MSEFYGDFDNQFIKETDSISSQITQQTDSLNNNNNISNLVISDVKYKNNKNNNVKIILLISN